MGTVSLPSSCSNDLRGSPGKMNAALATKAGALLATNVEAAPVSRLARIFAGDPAQWGRVLDWAEKKYYDDLAPVGQPF